MGENISQGEKESRQGELNEAILQLIEQVAIDEVAPGTQLIGHPKYRWIQLEVIGIGALFLGATLLLILNQLYIPAVLVLVLLVILAGIFGNTVQLYFRNQQTIRERGKQYYANLASHPDRTKVMIEGGSWFNYYKCKDISDHLADQFNVYSFAEDGSDIRGILKDNEFKKLVMLEGPQVVLLSAGGKELFEKYFKDLIQSNPTEGNIFTSYYTALLRDIIHLYEEDLEYLTSKSAKVIVSAYDFMVHKEGALHQLLSSRGIKDANALKTQIVNDLNTKVAEMVENHNNVYYLDLRNTLTAQDWQDEIHPSEAGFLKIAEKFKTKIQEITSVEV